MASRTIQFQHSTTSKTDAGGFAVGTLGVTTTGASMADNQKTDRMSQIRAVSDQIKFMESDIANREAAIKAIRKERTKLVTKRFRLQKAEGLA